MNKILCVILAAMFLSGCALSTIRPPKRSEIRTRTVEPVVERRTYEPRVTFTPKASEIEEKEEVLPEKEKVLPKKEKISPRSDIMPSGKEEIK